MTKVISNDQYLEIISKNFKLRSKIASFDLDNTIIKTKSGKVFPEDQETDWIFNYRNVKDKLRDLYNENFCIIIITNQKKLKDMKGWCLKIKKIIEELDIPIKVYASLEDDIYRKPNIGFWNFIKTNTNMDDSFYCGDAIGRDSDFSDTDYKFALNCNLNFKAPETLFLNKVIKFDSNFNYFDFSNFQKKQNNIKLDINKDMIIMIGYPGSGKSTFVNKILLKNNYNVISLDELKTKAKTIKLCKEYLSKNLNIVIDNTNPSKVARKIYIDLAKEFKYNIRCCIMTTTENHSQHNNMYRYLYQNKKKVPTIVYRNYNKLFEYPDKNEGISEIIEINPELPTKNTDSKYYFYLY